MVSLVLPWWVLQASHAAPPLSPQGSETADAVTTYGVSTWVPELNSDPEPPQQGLFPAEPSRRLNRTLKKSL